ncbi:hypothetical protein DTO012A8_7465 [Penicillium roqueforti]|uniref:Cell wall beta-glucan synthesis n=1 Tax=Penicillium roqueforti (strain FM164) TaxID=1365484 RepID=W6Q9K6_PENRF|nr:uncharacterized protein LCP9604111_655 [Penicillium roqueforti]CDM30869.1 Cell wall beta-glucan synthesis [Penicillium roqueforti FM164]KAF9253129.1 hypothetical protein LCP9604111_655 [Penicillium roqueforti]KAI1838646.1 hypothetical protein CBS147337_371 [Penicillium roqueforti]KAI2746349.1 hypothetical protein DTO012A1_1180 [Penicillium roqueforti]KAI2767316.1 hypothetical protein DTO012A8_7465 [Penicillium roqueforti]
MRFFISLAVAAMAAVAAANSKANPFSIPVEGYTFKVGEPTALKWEPTTDGTVSLILQWGAVISGNSGTVIASNIDNDGSYTWDVPSKLAAQPDYTIKIVSDDDSDDYNYIGRFTVEGSTVEVTSTSSTASSTTASTSTQSSTESSTSTTHTTTSEKSTSTSSATTSSPTTLTTASSTATSTATSTSASSTESSAKSTSASASASGSASSSGAASSTPASQSAVPTTNAGIANRVSGGMLALVAAALML